MESDKVGTMYKEDHPVHDFRDTNERRNSQEATPFSKKIKSRDLLRNSKICQFKLQKEKANVIIVKRSKFQYLKYNHPNGVQTDRTDWRTKTMNGHNWEFINRRHSGSQLTKKRQIETDVTSRRRNDNRFDIYDEANLSSPKFRDMQLELPITYVQNASPYSTSPMSLSLNDDQITICWDDSIIDSDYRNNPTNERYYTSLKPQKEVIQEATPLKQNVKEPESKKPVRRGSSRWGFLMKVGSRKKVSFQQPAINYDRREPDREGKVKELEPQKDAQLRAKVDDTEHGEHQPGDEKSVVSSSTSKKPSSESEQNKRRGFLKKLRNRKSESAHQPALHHDRDEIEREKKVMETESQKAMAQDATQSENNVDEPERAEHQPPDEQSVVSSDTSEQRGCLKKYRTRRSGSIPQQASDHDQFEPERESKVKETISGKEVSPDAQLKAKDDQTENGEHQSGDEESVVSSGTSKQSSGKPQQKKRRGFLRKNSTQKSGPIQESALDQERCEPKSEKKLGKTKHKKGMAQDATPLKENVDEENEERQPPDEKSVVSCASSERRGCLKMNHTRRSIAPPALDDDRREPEREEVDPEAQLEAKVDETENGVHQPADEKSVVSSGSSKRSSGKPPQKKKRGFLEKYRTRKSGSIERPAFDNERSEQKREEKLRENYHKKEVAQDAPQLRGNFDDREIREQQLPDEQSVVSSGTSKQSSGKNQQKKKRGFLEKYCNRKSGPIDRPALDHNQCEPKGEKEIECLDIIVPNLFFKQIAKEEKWKKLDSRKSLTLDDTQRNAALKRRYSVGGRSRVPFTMSRRKLTAASSRQSFPLTVN